MRHLYTLLLTSILALTTPWVSGQSVTPLPVVPPLVADTTKPSYKFRDLP